MLVVVSLLGTPARADCHYFTTVPPGADAVVQELRWPYWNSAYYHTWLSDNCTSSDGVSGYFYSGLALSAGQFAYTDLLGGNFLQRFYRVVTP